MELHIYWKTSAWRSNRLMTLHFNKESSHKCLIKVINPYKYIMRVIDKIICTECPFCIPGWSSNLIKKKSEFNNIAWFFLQWPLEEFVWSCYKYKSEISIVHISNEEIATGDNSPFSNDTVQQFWWRSLYFRCCSPQPQGVTISNLAIKNLNIGICAVHVYPASGPVKIKQRIVKWCISIHTLDILVFDS